MSGCGLGFKGLGACSGSSSDGHEQNCIILISLAEMDKNESEDPSKELPQLRAILLALEEKDTLLVEGYDGKKNPDVSWGQKHVIVGLIARIGANNERLTAGFDFDFKYASDLNAMRARIRAVRVNVLARLEELRLPSETAPPAQI